VSIPFLFPLFTMLVVLESSQHKPSLICLVAAVVKQTPQEWSNCYFWFMRNAPTEGVLYLNCDVHLCCDDV
jgi:hypothetical protein